MEIIIIVAVLAFCLLTLSHMNKPQRQARRSYEASDEHLRRAESALLRGQLDEARAHFSSARSSAASGQVPIFKAEASYGLARVAERSGDLTAARDYIKEALSFEAEFAPYNPNYASMLRRHLAEVEAQLKP